MEVQYKRNYNDCYMVIEAEEMQGDYEEQMMRQNEIRCLLSYYTMEVNHRIQFWYQITGKESLADYFRREGVTLQSLEAMIVSLQEACDEIKRYLLRQNRICLLPETVYLCKSGGKLCLFLCYCPMEMEDLYCQFRGIMEYALTRLDENQPEVSDVCYQLYDITLQEHYQFSQLFECVHKAILPEEIAQKSSETDAAEVKKEEDERGEGSVLTEEKVFDQQTEIPLLDPLPEPKARTDTRSTGRLRREKKKKDKGLLKIIVERVQEEMETAKEILPMLAAGSNQAGKDHKSSIQYRGKGAESDYIIDKKVFLIGNYLEENDACLHSENVSRSHARIFHVEEGCYLEDLGSKKGTFLNGERLLAREQRHLQTGDEILFGDVEYVFYE